jgi:hypothetical protein
MRATRMKLTRQLGASGLRTETQTKNRRSRAAWAPCRTAVLVALDYTSFMRGETPSARALRMVAGRFLRAKP